jgi:alkanesulfonate monooxygenase SsuD/methylene tetrahydromethanopterin reductase-like flavin-dependent oxidoreductase (luciferase family)
VGRGYRHSEFAGFCVPAEEAEARFDESLAVILKAWSSDEPFSHEGRFWHYHEIVVEPPTAQKPHPPVWIAAGNPESVRNVAVLGANLLLDQFASTEAIGERIALFKAECEARDRAFDPMDVAVARNLYVARDADDASAALARQASIHDRMIDRSRGPDGSRRSHIMAYADKAGATEAHVLFGPPQEIIAGLQALQAVGVRYVLVSGAEATRQSMQRFAADRTTDPGIDHTTPNNRRGAGFCVVGSHAKNGTLAPAIASVLERQRRRRMPWRRFVRSRRAACHGRRRSCSP